MATISHLWENSVAAHSLTYQNLQEAYSQLTSMPLFITAGTGPLITARQAMWIDEASAVPMEQWQGVYGSAVIEKEPVCENLGDFLLRKYNKEKVCEIT